MSKRPELSAPNSSVGRMLHPGTTSRKVPASNLRKIALTRAAFRNWITAVVLSSAGLILRRSSLVTRLVANLRPVTVTLVTTSGLTIRCPVLDVLPTVEVFAMQEYDHPAIVWNKVASVIDCGAHVGSFSLWVTRRTACHVVAVEPNPKTFMLLRKNVNDLPDRVALRAVAVAGTVEHRTLYDTGYSPSASLLGANNSVGSFTVEAVTLEMLIDQSGFLMVDVLKLDVEGAEQEIFRTVKTETLQKIRVMMIECHRYLGTDVAFIEARLIDAGMQVMCEDRHAETPLSLVVAWREPATSD